MSKIIRNKELLITICLIALITYFVFVKGIYASSNRIIGPYENAKEYKEFLSYEPWSIGENVYGEPIFCYEDNAFEYTKQVYKEELDKVCNEYGLNKLNRHNIDVYLDSISKLEINNIDKQDRYDSLVKLLNVYKNGQKRWVFVIGLGLNRVYK